MLSSFRSASKHFGSLSFYNYKNTFLGRIKMTVDEEYLRKLMSLEKLSSSVYRANYLKSPTGRSGNAYGGLLFAQSLKAAQMTLDTKRLFPHAMHTLFVLNADSTKKAEFRVETVRNGRSFVTRTVTAEQDSKTLMTTNLSFCVVSFFNSYFIVLGYLEGGNINSTSSRNA